jgi:hypothetical protein
LEKYLSDADDGLGRENCVVFRISLTNTDGTPGTTSQTETIGLQFNDFDNRIHYSSNHIATLGSTLPNRSEMFRVNGKEKGKLYGVGRENANGNVIEVKPEPDGTRADWTNSGPFYHHTELDVFALPISNAIAVENRLSSLNASIRMWLTLFECSAEEEAGDKLKSLWISKRKDLAMELEFDRTQGGMPVLLRDFTIDSKGKQTKEYLSETRTKWKKLEGEKERWIPEVIESLYTTKAGHRSYITNIELIDAEKLDQWIANVNWKALFEERGTNWYGNISRLILEKHKEDKGVKAKK